jgi:hypothetical protein
MTSRTLQMKKGTRDRKKRELEAAKAEGLHMRWIGTRDLPGAGIKTRMTCMKTRLREVHLLSSCEHAALLELWWDENVLTFFEAVPLPPEDTQRAALDVGVEHPRYGAEDEPVVLSTDLVAIYKRDGKLQKKAFSVKAYMPGRRGELTPRQLIEQRYWEREGVEFKAVVMDGMHSPRSKNLSWLLRAENDMSGRELSTDERRAQTELTRRLRKRLDVLVIDACLRVDKILSLPPGSGARAFRQLAALRRVNFDLNARDPVQLPSAQVRVVTSVVTRTGDSHVSKS